MIKNILLGLLLVVLPWADARAGSLAESFPYKLRSKYFNFYYGDDVNNIDVIYRVADGFIDIVDRDFFKVRFDFPLDVYVLENAEAFRDFLRHKLGMLNTVGLYGVYLEQIHGFVTYENAGFGTFSHEIMHPLLRADFPRLPEWAVEGIPAFFEKFFGYWQDNRPVLKFGFQNPWRIRELGARLGSLDLEHILNHPGQHDTSEKRMVSVFLYQKGKLRRYLDLARTDDRKGYRTLVEAAFEKPFSEIRPLWISYLQDVEKQKEKIMRTPASGLFGNRGLFEDFIQSLGLGDGSGS